MANSTCQSTRRGVQPTRFACLTKFAMAAAQCDGCRGLCQSTKPPEMVPVCFRSRELIKKKKKKQCPSIKLAGALLFLKNVHSILGLAYQRSPQRQPSSSCVKNNDVLDNNQCCRRLERNRFRGPLLLALRFSAVFCRTAQILEVTRGRGHFENETAYNSLRNGDH